MAKQLTIAVDLGADARFDVRATYADAAAAKEAEKAVKVLAELGRKELAKMKKEIEDKLYDPNIKTPRPPADLPEALSAVFALGALTRLDETLTDPKFITRDKAELALAVPMPKEILALVGGTAALGAAALVPAVQKVRERRRPHEQREQPEADRPRHPHLPRRLRPLAAGHRGQERQADPELARGDPAVHRAGQPVQAVQAGRAVGQRGQQGVVADDHQDVPGPGPDGRGGSRE